MTFALTVLGVPWWQFLALWFLWSIPLGMIAGRLLGKVAERYPEAKR